MELQDAIKAAEAELQSLNVSAQAKDNALKILNDTPLKGFEVFDALLEIRRVLVEELQSAQRRAVELQERLTDLRYQLKAKKADGASQDGKEAAADGKESPSSTTEA